MACVFNVLGVIAIFIAIAITALVVFILVAVVSTIGSWLDSVLCFSINTCLYSYPCLDKIVWNTHSLTHLYSFLSHLHRFGLVLFYVYICLRLFNRFAHAHAIVTCRLLKFRESCNRENPKSRACAYSERRGPTMKDCTCMAERGVGIQCPIQIRRSGCAYARNFEFHACKIP